MSQSLEVRRYDASGAIGPQTPERYLVERAAQRCEVAIRELIRRNNPRLFRVARGIVSSDAEAEDVVQDTYLAAFRGLDNFRGGAAFSTWITRIAMNKALSHLRRVRLEEEYDTVSEGENSSVLQFPGSRPESGEARYGRDQIRSMLEEAVARLPPSLRVVFLMSEAEGMSGAEIARDLGLNPITVKTRLFRARRWLKGDLEAQVKGGFEAIFPFDGARCAHTADRVVDLLTAKGDNGGP